MNAPAFFFAVLLAISSSSSVDASSADTGNWTVGDCILAQFSMKFSISFVNFTDLKTLEVAVPVDARVDGDEANCKADRQTLSLAWTGESANRTKVARNVTLVFIRTNDTGNIFKYGLQRLYGNLELAHFQDVDKKNASINVTSYVDVDTGDLNPIAFPTPVNRSFLCSDVGNIDVVTHLHYTYPGAPDLGTLLPNATKISAKNVQVDAFRPKSASQGFQTPMDCAYQPNDIVPIAVGVALAALVVIVLVAYMIGRRKRRQRGYQSV